MTTAFYILKDGTGISQKEERTKLREQKTSKGEMLKMRADVSREAAHRPFLRQL